MSMLHRAIMACAQASGPPLPLTNVVEIWDAAAGVTEAGTGVSSWLGTQAGVGMAQAVDGNRPSKTTTGGFDSLLFNGASDRLTTVGLTAPVGPKTTYAVLDVSSAAGARYYFDTQTGRLAIGLRDIVLSVFDTADRNSASPATTGLQLVTVQHSGSFATTWKNGVASAPVACASDRALGGTCSIGSTFSGGSQFSGHVLWLGVYNDTRDAGVEAYLQTRFGL